MYKSLNNLLSSFVLKFLGILIIFLPLQTLFQSYLERFFCNQSFVFWLSHWYEPIAAIFLILVVIGNFTKKEIAIDKYYLIVGALIDFGILSAIFISPSISRGLEGFRFTLFASLIFFIIMLVDVRKGDFEKLVKSYLTISVIVAIWAIVERVLPMNYWQHLGLSDFGFGQHKVVEVYQSQSIFQGSNQLASYLLPAIFIMIKIVEERYKSQVTNNKQISILKSQFSNIIFTLVMIAALILTFSRSAFVGLAIGLVVYAIISIKLVRLKYLAIALIVALIAFLYVLSNAPSRVISDLFSHGASHEQHLSALRLSIDEVKDRFQTDTLKFTFGSGLGTAGPSVLKYGDGFVSESWYLQLIIEIGIFGLALWLFLMYYLLRDLVKENKGLFLGLLSVSVAALFLHTWADNPALAITLFILMGIAVKETRNKKQRYKQITNLK